MKTSTEIKIAYIGGGSMGWAPKILADLALCDQLTGEIALYDIDEPAAQRTAERGAALFAHPDAQTTFRMTVSKTSEEALRGADFVLLSIQPGPIQMHANDLDIPAKYGIVQTVGDTTGPGGISRALRSIPTYVDYAQQIAIYCPDAWVINYTNPMTICTQTLYAAFPDIKAFGCCHEVFGTQKRLARLVADYLDVPQPPRNEIKLDVTGVNHFTFATSASWGEHDLYRLLGKHIADESIWADQTEWSLDRIAHNDYIPSQGLIAYNFLRQFGVLGAAGDRHLAEFVPWYLVSEAMLQRYGVNVTPSSSRLRVRKPKKNAAYLMKDGRYINRLVKSDEESVAIMLGILGLKDLDTNVNLPNRGQTPDLPMGHVVETYAQFRRNRVTPVVANTLPKPVNSLVRRVMDVQSMVLEAGLTLDKDLAFAALLADPLCCLSVDDARAMFDEMLAANAAMMKEYEK